MRYVSQSRLAIPEHEGMILLGRWAVPGRALRRARQDGLRHLGLDGI
ncbi:hypothetical protein ACFYY8_05385 [Streptosporangium sp. NPDC001559]